MIMMMMMIIIIIIIIIIIVIITNTNVIICVAIVTMLEGKLKQPMWRISLPSSKKFSKKEETSG